MWINHPKQVKYGLPSLSFFPCCLCISRSHTEQRSNQHTVIENKSCCQRVARNASLHPSSRPRPTADSIITGVDAWCVNRPTDPEQTETFESRSKRPTCAFNLNPPSLLKSCHVAELEAFFPLKLDWKRWCLRLLSWSFGWVSIFTVYLPFECQITANAQRKV